MTDRDLSLRVTGLLLLFVAQTFAQTNFLPSSGNVGIGTTTPGALLHVKRSSGDTFINLDDSANSGHIWALMSTGAGSGWAPPGAFSLVDGNLGIPRLAVLQNGNVGIGTVFPGALLHVKGSSGDTFINVDDSANSGHIWALMSTGTGSGWAAPGAFSLVDGTLGIPRWTVLQSGNVGIGTPNPQYPLAVNGTIQAKEVIVNTGWSDYVFDRNYQLKSLNEVAVYIKENHHLPEIPSEAEVEQKGISLGEMQSKLLAKIEELTLHMIEADEQNKQLAEQNRGLQQRVVRLESQVAGTGAMQ